MSSSTQLNPAGQFVVGVGCDAAAVLATQPLETIATYIQNGRGMPPFGRNLWHGTAAALSAAPVQGGLPFVVNGVLTRTFSNGETPSEGKRFAMALGTGLATSLVIAPFERAGKIQQMNGGTAAAAFLLGRRSLWTGVIPVAGRDAVVFGTFFGVRKTVEGALENVIPNEHMRTIASGAATGAVAGILSNPAAVINARMQGDLTGRYSTVVSTAKAVGVRGLFAGTGARGVFMIGYLVSMGLAEPGIRSQLPEVLRG